MELTDQVGPAEPQPPADASAQDIAAPEEPALQVGEAESPHGTHLLELWSQREEVHALPDILRPGEGVVAVGSGTVIRSGRLSHPRWLVVLTDRRLLCLKGRSELTRKVIDMPASAIRSVQRAGLLRATLTLDTGYGTLRLSGISKKAAAELEDGIAAVRRSLSGDDPGAVAIPRAQLGGTADPDGFGRVMEKLADLEAEVAALNARLEVLEEAPDPNGRRPGADEVRPRDAEREPPFDARHDGSGSSRPLGGA